MAYTKRRGIVKVERSTGVGSLDWSGGDGWQEIPGVFANSAVGLPSVTPSKFDVTTVDDLLSEGMRMQNMAGISGTKDPTFTLLLDGDDTIHASMIDDEEDLTPRDYRFTVVGQTRKLGARGAIAIDASGQAGDAVKGTVTITAEKINLSMP